MATAASVAAVTAALAAPPTTAPDPSSVPAATTSVNAQSAPPPVQSNPDMATENDDDIAWLNINELNGDESNELTKCINACMERWKNAGPEARKKMFALFAIAGIFVAVCRHGHVLVICDMIKSGEL
jgi:uncharacterized membrane protein YgcG